MARAGVWGAEGALGGGGVRVEDWGWLILELRENSNFQGEKG